MFPNYKTLFLTKIKSFDMYRIVPPLTTGQSGPDIRNLQDALIFLVETTVLDNTTAQLSVTDLNNERSQLFFGSTTGAFIELFKAQYMLQSEPNELVNTQVADAINTFIDPQIPNQHGIFIEGSISHTSGNFVASGLTVRVEQLLFSGSNLLGTTTSNDNGYFDLTIDSGDLTISSTTVAIVAIAEIDSEDYSSKVVYMYPNQQRMLIPITVDVDIEVVTEYATVYNKVVNMIGATEIKDITIDTDQSQAEFIANSVNETLRDIRCMVVAHRLSDQLDDMEPEMFYALLKGNVPEKVELMIFSSRSTFKAAIDTAAEKNIIQTFDPGVVDTFTGNLKPTIITNWNADNAGDLEKTISYRIYYYVLQDETLTNTFLNIFFSFETPGVGSEDFWLYLENGFTEFDTYIDALKAVTVTGLLSGNNPALAGALLAILEGGTFSGSETLPTVPGTYQPELLGRLTEGNWADILEDAKTADASNFLFPSFVEGDTDPERIGFYAARLYTNIRSLYTVQHIASRIADDSSTPFPALKDDLDTFLSNNPGLDLKALSILALTADDNIPYNLTGISDVAAFSDEIATLQRLLVVSDDYDVMATLAGDSLTSAYHVTTLGKDGFVETYDSVFGSSAAAGAAFDAADRVVTEVLTKFYESYADAVEPAKGSPWLPTGDPIPVGETDPPFPFTDPYADWRTLFGGLDSCNCCHCESIYSPSAYFVDTLNFIKQKAFSSWGKLLNRRPDMFHLELTCDNSDVPVPQIDIVNEMLEDMISIGVVYVRQTRAEAKYQRAIPEHMNTSSYDTGSVTINSPYPTLKTAQYPWSLPYNVYKRQINEYLNIPEVKPYELVQRFSTKDILDAIGDLDFCRNYVNASEELIDIITTSASISGPDYDALQPFYGMRQTPSSGSPYGSHIPDPQNRGKSLDYAEAEWVAGITGRIDVFLQQTHLTYVELLELLDCYFINPFDSTDVRKFEILRNSSSVEITTCNLHELKIDPVEFEELPYFLDRLHRFVRLSRLLGWHFYDLDLAMRAVAANALNEAGFKKIVQLKYLADTLKIKVEDACLLFQDVELLPYRNYRKEDDNCDLIDIPDQYTRIFRNESLANAHVPSPFPPSPPVSFSPIEKDALRKFLSGVTRLKAVDLDAILEDTYARYSASPTASTFAPSLSSLSYIYRQAVLMRALKLNSDQWQFFTLWAADSTYFGDLVGGDANNTAARPVSVLSTLSGGNYTANAYDAIRFCHFVRLFAGAGFKASDMEFILGDQIKDPVAELRNTESLQLLLSSMRGELATAWYPAFDADDADASMQLIALCSRFLDPSSAARLMDIVNREPDSSTYSADETAFLQTDIIAGIFMNAVEVLATPADPDYLADIEDRYNYIYGQAKGYIVDFVLKPIVTGYLEKQFSLSADSVFALLNDVIEFDDKSGFDFLLDDIYALSTGTIDRWTDFYDQFRVVILVQKVALLANRFSLGTQEILHFWNNTIGASTDPVVPDILMVADMPVRENEDEVFVPGTSSTATLRLLRNFIQWTEVRSFTGSNLNILFNTIRQEGDIPAAVAAVFRMTQADVNSLLVDAPPSTSYDGILDVDADGLLNGLTYLRIIDCLELQNALPAPMISLYLVAQATLEAADQDDVAAVIHLVKAPYSDDEWLGVIQPVNDLLRVERRDRMIDFLLAFPPFPYTYSWLSSNDIYETLLVDVEMMPIAQTTRILLATNAVQIWMSRTLLGLEADTINAEGARQWASWRKLYRVWEANRKIFIYPENWIEPELRDDKTPLFQELEKFLQQNDVTDDTVNTAYKTYLERLDQLSNLEIIGMYRDTGKGYQESTPQDNLDTLHVFGRTRELPHLYFYRKRQTGAWTPWEKMDVQIDGDHFVPVVWKGRLRIYWLVFAKDTQEAQGSSQQSEGSFEMPQASRWKINLAWTEYKDGHWLAKQQSRDALYSQFLYEERPLSFDHFNAYKTQFWYKNRWWSDIGDLEKVKQEGINFISEFDSNGNLRFRIIERDLRIRHINGDMGELIRQDPTTKEWAVYGDPGTLDMDKEYILKKWAENSVSFGRMGWKFPQVELTRIGDQISNVSNAYDVMKEQVWREDWGGIQGKMTGANEVGLFNIRFNGASAVAKSDTPDVFRSLYSHKLGDKTTDPTDLFHHYYWPSFTQYLYINHPPTRFDFPWRITYEGYKHYPDSNVELLRACPDMARIELRKLASLYDNDHDKDFILKRGFSINKASIRNPHKHKVLVFPRNQPLGYTESAPISIPYFFYKDHVNTFFVEKVSLQYDLVAVGISGPVSFMGEAAPPAKIDTASGTGLGLSGGIGSVAYDLTEPEADIAWGGDVPMSSSRVFTKSAYRFHNFEHQQVETFLEKLFNSGLDGLLNRQFLEADITDSMHFYDTYSPTTNVHDGIYYPDNKVDFSIEGAYAQYNWELFFHIPMLIANRLSLNQQFDQARKWYHYVFNPNVPFDGASKKRFWNFIPFNDKLGTTETIDYVMKSATLTSSVRLWAENPFKPHLVARTRLSAYMKNTVMKYLDNLIAWGDNLFRTDSREAINEATLLYILALQILGRRPEQIPARAKPEVQTYYDIYDKLNDFGNAMVKSENVLLSSGATRHYNKFVYSWLYGSSSVLSETGTFTVDLPLQGTMYLFCTPFNEKLLSYWDILADRLFKIRNSQNIDGVTRELALYAPPIDPAILVKAAASGISLTEVLADMNAPLPGYRFNTMSQKATELANEVKSLGSQLLGAMEKRDAEQISLLRSGQELSLLEAVTQLKETGVSEANLQWNALNVQLKSANMRANYYKGLIDNGWNNEENTQIGSLQTVIPLTIAQGVASTLGTFFSLVPQTEGPMPKVQYGGLNLATGSQAAAAVLGASIGLFNTRSSMAGIKAGFLRRQQDWFLQLVLAKTEAEQLTKQMSAAELRIAMAEMELRNHKLQVDHARDMDTAMHDKYTNQELYDWMVNQISFTYFQAYKLAYDTAKKAERSFRYELNLETSDYIRYGYWDSLKKGLLAGEALSFDLRRMETAYLDLNKRQFELTKHVSLASLDPHALLTLVDSGICKFSIPEWLYDLDFPGQHMRRIKSVSISIPCVAGPYTSISAKLSLTRSAYRKASTMAGAAHYEEDYLSDSRFAYIFGNVQSIATSSAQNDGGLFELNFRDERYLPFEGCGAISEWTLELPSVVAQFDYNTISDVILHIKYTALDNGALKAAAKEYVTGVMQGASELSTVVGLSRVFNLRQEFSNEWYQWLQQDQPLHISNIKARLPYMIQALMNDAEAPKTFAVQKIELWMDQDFSVLISPDDTGGTEVGAIAKERLYYREQSDEIPDFDNEDWYLFLTPEDVSKADIGSCWMVVHYVQNT
jgi:hypothetical protein